MNLEQKNIARVLFSIEGSIAHIHFEHPSARNAMTQEMYESLRAICQQIQNTPAIRVAILRGVGEKSFVSGSDIAQFASYQGGEDGIRYEAAIAAYLQPLQELNIPTIAVIEGFAIGGPGETVGSGVCKRLRQIAFQTLNFGGPGLHFGACRLALTSHFPALSDQLIHHFPQALFVVAVVSGGKICESYAEIVGLGTSPVCDFNEASQSFLNASGSLADNFRLFGGRDKCRRQIVECGFLETVSIADQDVHGAPEPGMVTEA